MAQLDKRSFAGGSVLAVHAENDFYKLRDSISGKRLKKKKTLLRISRQEP